jgi:glutamate dehydrogenase (NAD(P)+)
MEARYSPFRPDALTVLDLVSDRLRTNTRSILDEVAATDALPHDAARRIAQSRVRAAMLARGQIREIA